MLAIDASGSSLTLKYFGATTDPKEGENTVYIKDPVGSATVKASRGLPALCASVLCRHGSASCWRRRHLCFSSALRASVHSCMLPGLAGECTCSLAGC